ncbi:MAG: 50S ribosomal protein L15 [Actinomycetota bacterium]
MKLHHLRPAPGAHRKKKRVGRGIGSGHGKTSTRGTKGTGARGTVPAWFEGGQMPLYRRLPKLKGFSNHPFKTEYQPVNLSAITDRFSAGDTVEPATLKEKGLVRNQRSKVKILGDGSLGFAVTVKAHAFSRSAREKIAAAGGSVEQLTK